MKCQFDVLAYEGKRFVKTGDQVFHTLTLLDKDKGLMQLVEFRVENEAQAKQCLGKSVTVDIKRISQFGANLSVQGNILPDAK